MGNVQITPYALFSIHLRSAGNWRFSNYLLNVKKDMHFKTSGDRNNIFRYPEWLELLNFNFKLTVSFHCSIVGIFKIIRKTSRLLHRKLILGRPFRFFEVIALFFDDVNFSIIYSFFFANFSESLSYFEEV